MPISNTANIWQNTGESEQRSEKKLLLPGVAGQMGISFSASGPAPAERGIREIIAKLGQAAKLSSPLGSMICVIPLPNPSLILLPMDLIALRCRFQPFSNCSAMLTLRRQPSIPESLLMTSLV